MRNLVLITAVLLVYATSDLSAQRAQPAAGAAQSIAPGSTVQIVQEGVEMKSGTDVIALLGKGSRFKVRATKDQWVEVEVEVNGVMRTGWVLRSQVAVVPADGKPADKPAAEKPAEARIVQTAGHWRVRFAQRCDHNDQRQRNFRRPHRNSAGVIKDNAMQSKAWWPPRIVPPKDPPNILLIMTDDAGFGVPSTFGGVIPTPTMDRIAKAGLRYNRVFSTALCSPTRAALITGRNHHSVGFGVIAEQATGFPGYDSVIGKDNATIGRILRDNGYATSWFGKDHNTPTYQASQVGPFTQWPTGMGFDYFYGFVGGDANQWGPNLFRNTTQIYPFEGKAAWHLEPDHRDGRRRHRLDDADSPERPQPADLHALRARLLARAAPSDEGMGGQD